MPIDNTIAVDADFITESGTIFDTIVEFYEPDDTTPFPIDGYDTEMIIQNGSGKVVKKLTVGDGYTIAGHILTFNFPVDLPACDHFYKFRATNGSTFNKSLLRGIIIVN